MRHQVGPNPPRISLLDSSIVTNCNNCAYSRDVRGRGNRGNTVHPHHRVGHDGQNQVLSTQHAVLVLGQMLSISSDSDQDSASSAETKSHVQWYALINFDIESISLLIRKK